MALAVIAAIVVGGASTTWAQADRQAPAQAPTAPPTAVGRSAPAATAGNADAGRQAFTKKGCYACHGREGQGSPTTGPRLGPNPTPLPAFTRSVRAPRGQMPPYTEKLISNTELDDIYAFLQARPRPVSVDGMLPPK
jgi:ubiquinol-cytochrome c reductase cytochrome c subunit